MGFKSGISTNLTFEYPLKNPTSYLVKAGFKWVFEKTHFSNTHLKTRFYYLNKKWVFKWVSEVGFVEKYGIGVLFFTIISKMVLVNDKQSRVFGS